MAKVVPSSSATTYFPAGIGSTHRRNAPRLPRTRGASRSEACGDFFFAAGRARPAPGTASTGLPGPRRAGRRPSSAGVASGCPATSPAWTDGARAFGAAGGPPRRGSAASEPVRFRRRSSLVMNDALTRYASATSERVRRASSHAAATRSLRSSEHASMARLERHGTLI
jgi:hypothetical protein